MIPVFIHIYESIKFFINTKILKREKRIIKLEKAVKLKTRRLLPVFVT